MQLPQRQLLNFSAGDTDDSKRCHRCGSIMAYQKFYGPHEYFWGWRCICCGEIVDQIILENRESMIVCPVRR